MIRHRFCLILVTGLIAGSGTASGLPSNGDPRVFTMNGNALKALKARIRKESSAYGPALKLLSDKATEYLSAGPWTITKKTSLPPSGDPHDYESQGPYWWPNPATADGLPYVRRDGEKNPEIEKLTDHHYLYQMTAAVKTLALAYYLTGDEKFATRASLCLRTWFLDPATRMNPNLNYGQRIPGITDGRGIGIIETRIIGDITDAVGLIADSNSWRRTDQKQMEAWMKQYLDWLLNSKNGKDEADEHNNHGTWYDVQVAALALFTGQEDIARKAIMRTRDERLPSHIAPDGKQPHELARTRSWGYSVMNLESFFTLATLGEKVGVDLWSHSTSDGRSLRKALDYLVQFADPRKPKEWETKQITPWSPSGLLPLLYQASCRYPNGPYADLVRELEKGESNMYALLYPCEAK